MEYFTLNGDAEPFKLFSSQHLAAIMLLMTIYLVLFLSRNKYKLNSKTDKRIRYFVASALIFQELSLSLWRIYDGSWTLASSLPLHLCGILVLIAPIMLITKNRNLYDFVYLLGTAGATQAILTPDIGGYGFPHYRYYQFFLSHGLIIFSALYMTFVYKYRPQFKSVLRVFVSLNLMLPVIGLVNYLTGGNYFFIARKPATASIIDYLGDWPWYILSLEVVGFVLLLISFSPFILEGYFRKSKNESVENTVVG